MDKKMLTEIGLLSNFIPIVDVNYSKFKTIWAWEIHNVPYFTNRFQITQKLKLLNCTKSNVDLFQEMVVLIGSYWTIVFKYSRTTFMSQYH